jgi:hypothetical protein
LRNRPCLDDSQLRRSRVPGLLGSARLKDPHDLDPLVRLPRDLVARGAVRSRVYADGNYQYDWKTQKQWGNSCRVFVLNLIDGTSRTAIFKFS